MKMTSNLFASVDHLQPKCPGCGKNIEYGTTSKYNEKYDAHVCLNCGHVLNESLDKKYQMKPAEDEP